ncbi:hypothetical protein K490DRAFT_47935, partial [Saccharata proteae CBS 121410]
MLVLIGLRSHVIDSLVYNGRTRRPLCAYFYCKKNPAEPERSNPDEILRCLLKQLCASTSKEPIRGEILENDPAVIIVDALDECDQVRRHELLEALDSIIQDSTNLTKVFVSSRDDGDIVRRLQRSNNVFVHAENNSADILRFINVELEKSIRCGKLLGGKPMKLETREKIERHLESKAGGMFRWVSLQLQLLCDFSIIKVEEDMDETLQKLPKSLENLYDAIYTQILSSGSTSQVIAKTTFSYLMWLGRSIDKRSFIRMVSRTSGKRELSEEDILDVCCNLVVFDRVLHTFQFAHLSVLEYLQKLPEY